MIKNTFVLALGVLCAAPAFAGVYDVQPGLAAAICTAPHKPATTELGRRLEDLVARYDNLQSRVQDPEGYLKALDAALAESTWRRVYACRETFISQPNRSFQLRFLDVAAQDQTMNVTPTETALANGETAVDLTLFLSLKLSPLHALVTYVHESTHVCQHPAKLALAENQTSAWAALTKDEKTLFNAGPDPKDWNALAADAQQRLNRMDDIYGDYMRRMIIDELEGMFAMEAAYLEFVQNSSSFCSSKSDAPNQEFYKNSIEMHADIGAGVFPKYIAFGYMPYYEIPEHYLFDSNGTPKTYKSMVGSYFELGTFEAKPFHPKFRQELEARGIPFTE